MLLIVLETWPAANAMGQAGKGRPDRAELSRRVVSYAFVSPNTRENLRLAEAIASLSSLKESQLIQETRLLACRLHLAARVQKALGSWTDGAENSTLTRVKTDQATIRYAVSWLGKFSRQKSVLYYRNGVGGPSRIYVLLLSRSNPNIAALVTELDSDGIANRTLVPQKKRTVIYIVDLANELKDKVMSAARRLHARVSFTSGYGEFIGNRDDRDKAQKIFEQEIMKYEATHSRVRRTCRQIRD